MGISCGTPPPPARKFVVHHLSITDIAGRAWLSLNVEHLPSFVGYLFRFFSLLSTTLVVDGASLKLPRQLFFDGHGQSTFEGNLKSLGMLVWRRYSPLLRSSWRSMLGNSNAFAGGFLTRQKWMPHQRTVTRPFRQDRVQRRGALALTDGRIKYFSPGVLFIISLPVPGIKKTLALDCFLRPIPIAVFFKSYSKVVFIKSFK